MTPRLASQWLPLFVLLLAAPAAHSQTNLINFDDGTQGAPLGAFYASRGVVMSNAVWSPNVDLRQLPFNGCPGRFVLFSQVSGSAPTSQTPLVATFSPPVSFVAMTASDIGLAGARLEAYDAAVGGNLVGSAETFGSGVGIDISRDLEVAAPLIRRIHLFQPAPNGSDGVVWDNLRFVPVITRSASLKMFAGLELEGALGDTYRIECASSLPSTNWTQVTNITLAASPYLWIDLTSPTTLRRFYRAVLQ